jgi:hypothetical protein
MCAIVAIALFFTAYMAVVFNRRAKADLLAALTPLSEAISGEVDLEEASVSGRYQGHIATGRVANAGDGPGRVFLTAIIDGAGGSPWKYTLRRPKEPGSSIETTFVSPDESLRGELDGPVGEIAEWQLAEPGWFRIEYDPAQGHVMLTRPMATRRAIPGHDVFDRQLKELVVVAAVNRAAQKAAG